MEDVNFLLSDKYVTFAHRIIELLDQKKLIEEELKVKRQYTYQEFNPQLSMEELDKNRIEYNILVRELWSIRDRTSKAQEEFEAWKKECLANTGDG